MSPEPSSCHAAQDSSRHDIWAALGCGTLKACKQAYEGGDSPDWPIAELMGDFPAAAGVVTWRGGGLLITLTLFCMAEMIVFRLTGVLNSDVGLHGRLNAKAKPTGVALLVSSGLGHS